MARSKADLEVDVPCLAGEPYAITSDGAIGYNCFAWAEHETVGWLDPAKSPGNYWPDDVPRERTIEAYMAVYARGGFKGCLDGAPEEGFEKIAIYLDDVKEPSHAARLLDSGVWTSKLGRIEDIEHRRLESLEGSAGFGRVVRFMKRPKTRPAMGRPRGHGQG